MGVFLLIIAISIAIIKWRFYLLKKQKRFLEIKVIERTEEIKKQKEEISEQAVRISQMNKLLKKHNIELKDNVENLSKARLMQKMLSYGEFLKAYPDDTSCLKLISEIKWNAGFTCKKCKSHEYNEYKNNYMRRCKECFYKESATSGTIFHKLKFSLNKALYILILTSSGRSLNISQIAKELSLRPNTCWTFHKKVQGAIKIAKHVKTSENRWKELILTD